MQQPDLIRLRHMLEAAEEATSFAAGASLETLAVDRKLSLALVKSIEIIGEAASHVSKECQIGHTDIPWAKIIGMRNRLIHAYFDIDLKVLLQTVTKDIPPLLSQLKIICSGADE